MRRFALPLLLLLIAAGLGFWGYRERQAREELALYLENQYARSFYGLVHHVDNTQNFLAKALAANSPRQLVTNASEVWRQADQAQANLSQLPLSDVLLARTEKFFTQVGDFAYTIAKKNAGKITLSDKEYNTLRQLYDQARKLGEDLHSLEKRVTKGGFSFVDIVHKAPIALKKMPQNPVTGGFRRVEKQLNELPALVYDGPFSDKIVRSPKGLTGDMISQEAAGRKAAAFLNLGVKPSRVEEGVTEEGQIPSWRVTFPAPRKESGTIVVEVSKKGGHIVWLRWDRPATGQNLGLKEARQKAEEFLHAKVPVPMEETSFALAQGQYVFSFAALQDGIIVYPDLIKVTVDRDKGEIAGYEARNFLMAHHDRTNLQPVLTKDQAQSKVNPRLQISRSRLAVIPTETGGEVLAYEFKGTLAGNDYLVYINAANGNEENILQLITRPDGVFAQ